MATKNPIDLVFLIDSTGSMYDAIDGLKQSIKAFFGFLTDSEKNAFSLKDWRAKVVGFRDVEADDQWIVNNPFVTSTAELEAQLDALEATGGGDEPEDILDALLQVAEMDSPEIRDADADGFSWRHRRQAVRAIVAFTDARYHPMAKLPHHNGATFQDVQRKLVEQNIILDIVTPVAPFDDSVDPQEFEAMYEDLAGADKCEYVQLTDRQGNPMTFQDIPKNLGLFRSFMEQLAKSISQSAAVPL